MAKLITLLLLTLTGFGAAQTTGTPPANESDSQFYGQSPPVYPCPVANGTTSQAWANAFSRATKLVSQMTVEEVVNITNGWPGQCIGNTGAVPRLGVPPLCLADGPSGVRGQEFVSGFPAGIHMAATFDRTLLYQYGRALGYEFRGKGVNVALGPVAGPLGRIAVGNRNWEGLGNDPYLADVGMAGIAKGIQDAGAISSLKHWLLNEQDYRRNPSELGEALSSNVDDRTLHELYAYPFMGAIRDGASSVMCSYNRANNSYACQNSKLLNGVLKTELGFEGFVVSDWGAGHTGIASANAGLDLIMPDEGFWGSKLVEAVNNGSVARERVDDMATRVLAAWYFAGQDEGFPKVAIYDNLEKHEIVDVQNGHGKLIREMGAAGTVLVKNVNKTLPLRKPRFISVFGYDAEVPASPWKAYNVFGANNPVNLVPEDDVTGTHKVTTLNGTVITAGASGSTTPPYVISPFQALQYRIADDGGVIRWDFYSINPTPYWNSEACLVFINAYPDEGGFDRVGLSDDFSDQLVDNVASNCSNTIVVVHSPGIRLVDPWVDHPNVTAILFAGIPGQETGRSLVDVLYGDVNPSGRLPYTVARQESDYGHLLNYSTGTGSSWFPQDDFVEGLFIDYRAFDRDDITPRYEFGFGLSYTSFAYSDLMLHPFGEVSAGLPDPNIAIVAGGHPQLWDTLYTATIVIENTGNVAGSEVAQLYLGIPVEDTPARQLRGFEKVPLQPGERKTVTFALTRRDLSYWDVVAQNWRVPEGEFKVFVGASSRDLRLNGTFTI
ncbi:glycosyl hydrolase family 3 N terminal domain-containing protein [Whalleya microplaca]|nr:glycosyl hydrolase family 3 N terminal domain-containing protein [Whalleya microplaca]